MADPLDVQIVIATYNRSKLLSETLASLSSNVIAATRADVIVVNNNSTDDTRSVAESFTGVLPRLRLIDETSQGLSYARNSGVNAASGDIVVFLDDDVEIDSDWLPKLLEPFSDPSVAVVGGRVLPFGMQEFPEWLPREYGYLASVFSPADSIQETDKVMGANFAVRRTVFRDVGLFDVKLGRKGKKLLGGEEVELFHRIKKAGHKIIYTPHSVVWHKIADKLKREYIEDYAYWLGVSEAAIDRSISGGLKHALKAIRSAVFPWSYYILQRGLTVSDSTSRMRYAIRRNYSRGYLFYSREIADLN